MLVLHCEQDSVLSLPFFLYKLIIHVCNNFIATGIGDDCVNDWDGDQVPDTYDANKKNNKVKFTDFRQLEKVNLHTSDKESKAQWIVRQKV